MGGIRQIKKQLSKQVYIVKTGLQFGGSDILLAVSSPSEGKAKVEAFVRQVAHVHRKASEMTIGDMYLATFGIRDKLLDGSPLWN